jgi:hypothetical protein
VAYRSRLACLFILSETLWALRGRAALLDGPKLSVIDFWESHYRGAGANPAYGLGE